MRISTGEPAPPPLVGPPNQFTQVAEIYDSLMSVVPYDHWVDYVQQLWQSRGIAPRRVLELACGTGNVLVKLARRGMTVDGIDNSAEMLAQARRKAPSSSALVLQDIRRLDLPGSYDACVCLFDSLNYLDSADELHQVFRGVARVLRPGGCLIFDLNTIHALESGMFDQTGCGFDNRVTFEWRSAWEPEARRCTIRMEFRVREDGGLRVFHETHVQHAFTRREVESALVRAGFVGLECLEAYTIDPPTARTDRVYWIAQAPGAGGAAEAGAADGPRL